jgi:hypothetical protein
VGFRMQLGISLAFIANARLTDIVGLIQPRDQTVNVIYHHIQRWPVHRHGGR